MDGPDREDLRAAEAARIRRRERERSGKERELMRTGQAKAFKQILDAQEKRARAIDRRRTGTAREPGAPEEPAIERRSADERTAEWGDRGRAGSRRDTRERRGDRALRDR